MSLLEKGMAAIYEEMSDAIAIDPDVAETESELMAALERGAPPCELLDALAASNAAITDVAFLFGLAQGLRLANQIDAMGENGKNRLLTPSKE